MNYKQLLAEVEPGVADLVREASRAAEALDRDVPAGWQPLHAGLNVIEWVEDGEPEPEPPPIPEPPTPEPEPEPPPEPLPPLPEVKLPRTLTITSAPTNLPTFHWWGPQLNELVITVPREWYREAWENGPLQLLERLRES